MTAEPKHSLIPIALLSGILPSSLPGYAAAFAGMFPGFTTSLAWFIFGIMDVDKPLRGDGRTYPFTIRFIK